MSEVSFTQVVQRGCGVDVHRDEAVATIVGEGLNTEPRSYKTFSSSLTEFPKEIRPFLLVYSFGVRPNMKLVSTAKRSRV